MKTFSAKESDISRKWFVVDAAEKPLGRLAVEVAKILRGKHKPIFTPHMDTGDHVIVINASQVKLTGNKGEEDIIHHTLWPGGIRSITRAKQLEKTPERAVERVIRGMLPHNKLGDATFRKLKVYRGSEHPHSAQNPENLQI